MLLVELQVIVGGYALLGDGRSAEGGDGVSGSLGGCVRGGPDSDLFARGLRGPGRGGAAGRG